MSKKRDNLHHMMRFENQFDRTSNLADSRQRAYPVCDPYGRGYWQEEPRYSRRNLGKGGPRVLSGNWVEDAILDDDLKQHQEKTGSNYAHAMRMQDGYVDAEQAKKVNMHHARPRQRAQVAPDRDGKLRPLFLEESSSDSKPSSGKPVVRGEGISPYLISHGEESPSQTEARFKSLHQLHYAQKAPPKAGVGRRQALMEKLMFQKAAEEQILLQAEMKKKREEEDRLLRQRPGGVKKPSEEELRRPDIDVDAVLKEDPTSFYTESTDASKQTQKTTIYHTRHSGGKVFGRCSKFSKPISEKYSEEW